MTRRLAKPRPVQGETGSTDAARRGAGYAARATGRPMAKRDGHPRQNPAYRPATETPAPAGVFMSPEMVVRHYAAFFGSRMHDQSLDLCVERLQSACASSILRRGIMTTHIDMQRLTSEEAPAAAPTSCRRRIDGDLPYGNRTALAARCAR